MFVVIPVADEPRNNSLPYALDSIRRHTDYTPVTIGKNFGLCDHINTIQAAGRAAAFTNTDLAMRTACERIGEPFIWSADDIYWMRPAAPIMWAIGKLESIQKATVYAIRKRATAHHLRELGLLTFDYEAHTPMPVNPNQMMTVLDWVANNPMLDKRSLYGNMVGAPDKIAPDVKIRGRIDPIPDTPWLSTHDRRTFEHVKLRVLRSPAAPYPESRTGQPTTRSRTPAG